MSTELYRILFQRLADLLLDGDPMEMTMYYAYPLPVYTGQSVRVEQTPRDTVQSVKKRRAEVKAREAAKIRSTILEVSPCADGRLSIRCSWQYLGANDRCLDVSVIDYFCTVETDGSLRIRLMHFETLAFSSDAASGTSKHGAH